MTLDDLVSAVREAVLAVPPGTSRPDAAELVSASVRAAWLGDAWSRSAASISADEPIASAEAREAALASMRATLAQVKEETP